MGNMAILHISLFIFSDKENATHELFSWIYRKPSKLALAIMSLNMISSLGVIWKDGTSSYSNPEANQGAFGPF